LRVLTKQSFIAGTKSARNARNGICDGFSENEDVPGNLRNLIIKRLKIRKVTLFLKKYLPFYTDKSITGKRSCAVIIYWEDITARGIVELAGLISKEISLPLN